MVRRLAIVLLGLIMLVPVAPARAGGGPDGSGGPGEIYEEAHYDNPYSFTDDSCGFTFNVEGRARGHFVTRVVPGSDGQAFLIEDHYRFRDVLTNPENGRWMTISGRGVYKERSAKHIEGNIWEFIATDTGTPFVMRSSWGKTLVKDHGQVTFRQVFDTLGDRQPGGEEISNEVVKTRGDFPSLEPDFDFCAVVAKQIGPRH